MARKENTVFDRYKGWRQLTDKERITQGLPLTQREFSNRYETTEQTLCAWNKKIDGVSKVNGDFNPKNFMDSHLESTLKRLINIIEQKGTAKHIEMALKIAGLLVEKREETHKIELTPTDYTEIGRNLVRELRDEYESTGICSICGEPKKICEPVCSNPESEQSEDREVAAVAVSVRPD